MKMNSYPNPQNIREVKMFIRENMIIKQNKQNHSVPQITH